MIDAVLARERERHDRYLEVVSECDRFGRVLLAQKRSQMVDDQVRVVVRFHEPVELVSIVFVGEQESQVGLLSQMLIASHDVGNGRDRQSVRDADLFSSHGGARKFADEEVAVTARSPGVVDRLGSSREIFRCCDDQAKDARGRRRCGVVVVTKS